MAETTLTEDMDMLALLSKRAKQEEELMEEYSILRTGLLMREDGVSQFVAVGLLKLQPIVDWEADTAWTDGKVVAFHPAWFLGKTQGERLFILAHELFHCLSDHFGRVPAEVLRLYQKDAKAEEE